MSGTAITVRELTARVLAIVHAHPGCELVKEIAITPVEITGAGMTWHANLVDSGGAEAQRAASVLRQARDDLEPMFELVDEPPPKDEP
jgi:hypothetical protein